MKQKHIDIRVEQCLLLAKASNCPRNQFGALLLDPQRNVVLMDGYNGGPRGGGRLCGGDFCIREKLRIEGNKGLSNDIGCHHAEVNVVCNAAANGVATSGAWMICNGEPCIMCAKIIHHAGIARLIVVTGGYKDLTGVEYLRQHDVEVHFYKGTTYGNESRGESSSGAAPQGGADGGGGLDGQSHSSSRGLEEEGHDGFESGTARLEASSVGSITKGGGDGEAKEEGANNSLGVPETDRGSAVEEEVLVSCSPGTPVSVDVDRPGGVADLGMKGNEVAIAKKKDGVSDVHVTKNGDSYICHGCVIMQAHNPLAAEMESSEVCETVYAMHYHLRVHASRGHLVEKNAFKKLEKQINRERKTNVSEGRKYRRAIVRAEKEERQARKRAAQATSEGSTPPGSASNGTAVSTQP